MPTEQYAQANGHLPKAPRVRNRAKAAKPVVLDATIKPDVAVKAAKPAKAAKPVKPDVAATPAIDRGAVVSQAVAEIGVAARKLLPPRAPKAQVVAADYWAGSLVMQLAEAWRIRAKREAVAMGVLPDHTEHPSPVGTAETVYTDPMITIAMKVVEQAARVDVPGLIADLQKLEIKPTVLARLLKKHTKTFPGAHIFTASLT